MRPEAVSLDIAQCDDGKASAIGANIIDLD
jgi:hypothetical protein